MDVDDSFEAEITTYMEHQYASPGEAISLDYHSRNRNQCEDIDVNNKLEYDLDQGRQDNINFHRKKYNDEKTVFGAASNDELKHRRSVKCLINIDSAQYLPQ
jgi:hypothetical protein